MFGGSVVMRNSGPTLRQMVISSSHATYGGAITIVGSNVNSHRPLLYNVSVLNSRASREGGALFTNDC